MVMFNFYDPKIMLLFIFLFGMYENSGNIIFLFKNTTNFFFVNYFEMKKKEENVNVDKEKFEQEENGKKILVYENKYIEKYKKLENNEITEEKIKSLSKVHIMEYTPLGNVLMFYNFKDETFSYYSDHSIPYRFLEVCARKFVTTFGCKTIYIDLDEEIEKSQKNVEEKISEKIYEKENAEGGTNVVKKNVFAKLKNYNTENINNLNKTSAKNSINNKTSANKGKNRENNVIMNNYVVKSTSVNIKNAVIKEKANKYNHLGKIMNFNFLKTDEFKKKENENRIISYKNYKDNLNLP